MTKKFYITTTLPYVNAKPHIGFGLEIVEADVIARYHRLIGNEVIFNTGTDEHGQKIYQKALELGKDPKLYCDENAEKFSELKEDLNLSLTNFIRTTDKNHIQAAQEFWKRCDANQDIYKKLYKIKYCVGCELEKTDSELDHGECPMHPNQDLEIREEENYFFRFSNYHEKLLLLYKKDPKFVQPEIRMREIVRFVEGGLQDFSISRLKEKMPWGVPVPGDEKQVMYVWFDALVNYISTLGWPDDTKTFNGFWPGIQIAGKDNLRQQSAMWQAMLMSAGLSPSKKILINGFINVSGQKMSKSLGNVIAPKDVTSKFGIDATRYLLVSLNGLAEDMDTNFERFTEKYNADLANDLGNCVNRVLNLAKKVDGEMNVSVDEEKWKAYQKKMNGYEIYDGLQIVFDIVKDLNRKVDQDASWNLLKEEKFEEHNKKIADYLGKIFTIAYVLQPFLPETSEKIFTFLSVQPSLQKHQKVYPQKITNEILFPRK